MNRLALYRLLRTARRGERGSRAVDLFIIGLIFVGFVSFVVGSLPDLDPHHRRTLVWIEHFVLAAFTVEYVLRLYACTASRRYQGRMGRLKYALTPLALIDLVAILPLLSLLPLTAAGVVPPELTTIRGLRLVRLLKIARYSRSLRIVWRAVWRIRKELAVIASLLVLVLVIASTLLYSVEHRAQPEVFRSIPDSMWYGIVVMTTLGLGDVVVVTPAGKVLSGLLAVAGIATFAVPAGLLGAAFVEEFRRATRDEEDEEYDHDHESQHVSCPYCRRWFYTHPERPPAEEKPAP